LEKIYISNFCECTVPVLVDKILLKAIGPIDFKLESKVYEGGCKLPIPTDARQRVHATWRRKYEEHKGSY